MASISQNKRELISVADVTTRDLPVSIARVLATELSDNGLIEIVGGQLYSLVEEHGRKNMIVNLGKVQSSLTYFLGKLVGLQKRINVAKGKLALCSVQPYLLEALQICGLKSCFSIYADEEEALRQHF